MIAQPVTWPIELSQMPPKISHTALSFLCPQESEAVLQPDCEESPTPIATLAAHIKGAEVPAAAPASPTISSEQLLALWTAPKRQDEAAMHQSLDPHLHLPPPPAKTAENMANTNGVS